MSDHEDSEDLDKGRREASGSEAYGEESSAEKLGNESKQSAIDIRKERLKNLRLRKNESVEANRQELYGEFRKSKINQKSVALKEKQREEAELELAKLEAKESGQDFERRRAWDWTVEESEKWDQRTAERKEAVEASQFSDYNTAAERVYLKDLKTLKPDLASYNKKKFQSLENSPAALISAKDGSGSEDLLIVDHNNSFYNDLSSADFVSNKPPPEAVDRLVNNIRKSDEKRMKKRQKQNPEGHVTYGTYYMICFTVQSINYSQ